MSSSPNISDDNEENNSPDQIIPKDNYPNSPKKDTPESLSSCDLVTRSDTQKSPSKLNSEVENINNPPLNEGSVKNVESFVSNIEESSGGRGDVSIKPNNDDDELGYDDDLDDGDELINEDALLEESVELEDDLNKVQEKKKNIETQDKDLILLEKAEKKVENSILIEAEDINNPTNTLGEAEKVGKKNDNLQHKLLEVGKEPENQKESSGQEKNQCTIHENQKLVEIFKDVTAEDDIMADDTKDTDDKNTSTLSQDSSFKQTIKHGLNEPDMMLEIPTQEFIEFSDEDNELEGNSFEISPGIEDVIDLEDNILDMDEKKMKHAEESVKSSIDVDMTVSADLKTNTVPSQVIVHGYESCEDVNMDVADNTKNDITRNSLSYEAEIAADIITKEMNNVDLDETQVIYKDNKNAMEEFSTKLENELKKETTSQLKLEDTADVIELSDDIVEIEEDSGSSSPESLPDQKAKIENSIKLVELDEDILNEAEEIDNLILTTKISKTKLWENNAKASDNPYKSSTRTCEKSKSKQNTNVNVEISIEKANKVVTEADRIDAMEISDEISISTAAKKMDSITSDELVKEEGMIQDVSYQSVLSPDKMQITTLVKKAEVCRSKQDTTVDIKPVSLPDNQLLSIIDSNLPQESSSKLNMADLSLEAHSEAIHKKNTTSERESHISKSPGLVKLTTEPNASKIDDPMSSASNIDISEINDCKNETESNSNNLKSSALEVIAENPSQVNQAFVSSMEESMDTDVIEQSKPINEMEPSETAKPKLSSSNTEPKTSDSDIPQSSLSKIESKMTETCEPTLLTSNIELSTSEMTASLQKIEVIKLGTVELTPSLFKVEPIVTETCEPMTIESSAPITIESCKQTQSTSNLESITSETVASTLMIDPKIIEAVDPNPQISALNVEMITIEACEPTISEKVDPIPSSKPTMSEKVDPTPSTSKIEPIETLAFSSNIDGITETVEPQTSTSMSELQTSESMEPQPSTSKCDTEEMDSKPSSPKNQPAFDSLVQDSSNDVTEMTDSLGLLAESSRVMEDDDDDGEDEDDSEPDDESNQVTAEHSEDSSAHHSESDGPKYAETLNEEKQEFDFNVSESTIVEEMIIEKMECDEGEVEISCVKTVKNEESDALDENGEVEISCVKTVTTEESEALDVNIPSNDNETKAMYVETLKLLDTSDTEYTLKKEGGSVLQSILLDKIPIKSTDSDYTAKTMKLSISKQECVSMSYVDLEESSSDEDKIQPQTKTSAVEPKEPKQTFATEDISSDVPQNETTEVVKKKTETIGNESPKPAPDKDEVKPKEPQGVAKSTPSKVDIPQEHSSDIKVRSPMGLEIFSLDSDEEDFKQDFKEAVKQDTDKVVAEKLSPQQLRARGSLKCINRFCTNTDPRVGYYLVDTSTAMYFDGDKSKRAYVCQKCSVIKEERNQELIESVRNFTPLYQLRTSRDSEDLVEISDSDSDDEPEPSLEQMQLVGSDGAKMLEEHLEGMFNETWEKFKMDDRLEEIKNDLQKDTDNLHKKCQEIYAMYNECEAAMDNLRNSIYATFEPDIQELPAIIIFDKPNCSYSCLEPPAVERRQKRALSPSKDNSVPPPAKKPATPAPAPALPPPEVVVETAPQDMVPNVKQEVQLKPEKIEDDNMDVSVVTLSTEAAPADLPPPGDLSHPPVKVGMTVYAMKNAFGTWLRAKVVEIQPKTHNMAFTMVRVRFEHKVTKNPFKTLPARCLAYFEPSEVRMTIGTRVIALFKDISARQAYYSGVIAEIPNPVNKYRYLVFFDDGYAQYAPHSQTRLVCEFSSLVWEEVHPYSREFVRSYLLAYPERPMVRLHAGQNLKTEWRGKWWSSRVVSVDSSLVEVQFLRCDRREWIYRGSTRLAPLYLELQAAERHRPRALPRTQPQARINMPYVEYTRSDEQANKEAQMQQQRQQELQQQQNEEIRRQRAVAKKSTTLPPPPPPQPNSANLDNVTSRVVYYTPKNAVKPHKMIPHTCSPKCKRTDVLALKDLRTYNPLAKPLLSGWERQILRCKGTKAVMYVAPCGRRLRTMRELHRYLRATDGDMSVDLFDFSPGTHCLAEFVLNKCFVGKKDLSHGKEIVPVPCVNYYDDSLPEFCSYNTERTPTAGVPLNLDPEFLCGCDCEDDCEDKTKCACWKMTLEGARTIGYDGDVGYKYRRLPEPLPSGIYECNSRCNCKNTCLNRVAQHPLQLKLQVFKTLNRGWGIRALNDVPKGAFLCIYAGNLLTDATANLDGLNEGDEYLAELDYIEVVEQMKEGYEEDIPDKIKAKDKKALAKEAAEEEESSSSSSSSEEETIVNKNEEEDGDFQPGYIGLGVAEFNKRLRRRDSKKEAEDAKQQEKEKEANADEECITISDDEEVREPSCFTAAAGMGKNTFISKYRSVRTLFGEDEACYIMDAKVQGNIGRYLNHSCTPNVFVQNVFVDTHDPRFPWVAFFALHQIRAGTELTWNYNYDVGSVPGKVLYCFCGAQNCRGRLL